MLDVAVFCWIVGVLWVAYGFWRDRRFVLLGVATLLLGFASLSLHQASWLSFALTTVASALIVFSLMQHLRARREQRDVQ